MPPLPRSSAPLSNPCRRGLVVSRGRHVRRLRHQRVALALLLVGVRARGSRAVARGVGERQSRFPFPRIALPAAAGAPACWTSLDLAVYAAVRATDVDSSQRRGSLDDRKVARSRPLIGAFLS